MSSYTKLGWVNNSTPALSADNLNHMEDGIEANAESISTMTDTISTISDSVTDLDDKIESLTATLSDIADIESVNTALAKKENLSNKATSFDNSSADSTTYPTTAAVKKYVNDYCLLAESDDIIATDHLQDGAVTTDKIADSAVTTAKITDKAVTTAKIASNAVIKGKLSNNLYSEIKAKFGIKDLTVCFDENYIPLFVSNSTALNAGTLSTTDYKSVKYIFISSAVTSVASGTVSSSWESLTDIYWDRNSTTSTSWVPDGVTVHFLEPNDSTGDECIDDFSADDFIINALLNMNNAETVTEKIADGAVTEEKLSNDVAESLALADTAAQTKSTRNLLTIEDGTYSATGFSGVSAKVSNNHVYASGYSPAGTANIAIPFSCVLNGTYTLSIQNVSANHSQNSLYLRTASGAIEGTEIAISSDSEKQSVTFSVTEDTAATALLLSIPGSTGTDIAFDVQLESAEEMTDFIPSAVLKTALDENSVAEENLTEELREMLSSEKLIADGEVTTEKIADGAVTADKLSDECFDVIPTEDSGNLLSSGTIYSTVYSPLSEKADVEITKNLLVLENGTYENSGITVEIKDNHVTVSGTSTANANVDIPVDIPLSGTYTFSAQNILLGNTQSTVLQLRTSAGIVSSSSSLGVYSSTDLSSVFTNDTETVSILRIYVSEGMSPIKEFDLQLEQSEEMTAFVPPVVLKNTPYDGSVSMRCLDSSLKSAINGKYDASNIESGTGELTVYTQSAIDSDLIQSAEFEYQKTGGVVNIFFSIVFNEGSISYLQFTGLPYVSDDLSNSIRHTAVTDKKTSAVYYNIGSWLTITADSTIEFSQDEVLKGIITIFK